MTCTSCFQSDWEPVRATTNDFVLKWESFLRKYGFFFSRVLKISWIVNLTLLEEYSGYTCSDCNGQRYLHKEVSSRLECKSFKSDRVESCEYPCAKTKLDRFAGSPSAELQFFATQLAKGTHLMLNQRVNCLFA